MSFSDQSYNLRIELDTKNCTAKPGQIEKMERALAPLREVTQDFPVSDLYVTVYHHSRSGDYHVKTSLVLSGRTLFTGEHHRDMYPAFQRCVDKLVRKVRAYKQKMGNEPEQDHHRAGTAHAVVPTQNPDHEQLISAVEDGDYPAFRDATLVYEEAVRKRIGRWIQRYPELDQQIGGRIQIADVVEDLFLTAFEEFDNKPQEVPAGDWLETLIDPVIREFIDNPDEVLENVSAAQTAREISRPRED